MTHEQMTVHKALAELKTIDSRIAKAMDNAHYVVAIKHSAQKINGMTVGEFIENMKSDYQKVNDLIARRDAMKRAVVLSNATTKVNVGGREFTVAEAIELKNHGMEFKKKLLNYMTYAYNQAQNEFNKNNGEALEKRAEKYVLDVINAQPKDSKMGVDSEAMKAVRQTYIDNNKFDMLDPLDVKKAMEKLEAEISEFETDVDSALSVSNALTVIEFEY